MKVKICGITKRDDALFAADLGADALGFIFVKSSPRYITPRAARRIIQSLPPFVVPVGVFADAPQNDIRDIIEQTHIGSVQLHGNETPRQCMQHPVPVIKSFGVDEAFRPGILQRYTVSAFLLDTKMSGLLGGTGKTFDWAKAVNAKKYGPIILAGGLTPQNIIQAVEIVQPYAVDVNSGIEEYPGKKDHAKLKLLFQQLSLVREVTATAKHSMSNISERIRHLSRQKESGT